MRRLFFLRRFGDLPNPPGSSPSPPPPPPPPPPLLEEDAGLEELESSSSSRGSYPFLRDNRLPDDLPKGKLLFRSGVDSVGSPNDPLPAELWVPLSPRDLTCDLALDNSSYSSYLLSPGGGEIEDGRMTDEDWNETERVGKAPLPPLPHAGALHPPAEGEVTLFPRAGALHPLAGVVRMMSFQGLLGPESRYS